MSRRRHRFNQRNKWRVPAPQNQAPQVLSDNQIGIPPPPDHIFKYRQDRNKPANSVWGQGNVSYIPVRAEYNDGEGNFVHYGGAFKKGEQMLVEKYPIDSVTEKLIAEGWIKMSAPPRSETVCPVDFVYAMQGLKSFVINDVRLLGMKELRLPLLMFVLIGKKSRGKVLNEFCKNLNITALKTIGPFYLKDGYYCKFAKEVRRFILSVLTSLGVEKDTADQTAETGAMFFENDNAYRFRGQDLASETTMEKLLDNLPKEISRLVDINRTRETVIGGGENVTLKFRAVEKMLKYLWYIPSIRKILRKALKEINLENCKLTKETIYHSLLYNDYNVRGKTFQERLKILEEIHGTDKTTWPPRMCIKQNI